MEKDVQPRLNARMIGLLVLTAVLLLILSALYMPAGIDWYETFRPAGLVVFRGRSPYAVEGFRYAPWTIAAVLPFAWLPERLGRACFFLVSLSAFGYTAYKLGAKPLTLGAFLVSPPVLHCLLNANIDWLPLLGFVLPPQIGLFFVIIKPQVGIGMAVYWGVKSLRHEGWWKTVKLFAPVSIAVLLSFLLFGFWPMRFAEPVGFWWNASLWPASIPVGMALMASALLREKPEYAMAASPCLSPYVLLHSWSGALVALSRFQPEMVSAVVGLWIMVILRAF